MGETDLEARRALREYIALLQEIDERYLGDEWMSPQFGDTVEVIWRPNIVRTRSSAAPD